MKDTKERIANEVIAAAFFAAKKAAQEADPGPAFGACNFDTAVIRLPGVDARVVKRLAREAGIDVAKYKGKSWFVFAHIGEEGQRTITAEAAAKAMSDAGLPSYVWYCAD